MALEKKNQGGSGGGATGDLSNYATKSDLANKVTKETDKSLVDNALIEKLENLENYDDTEIKQRVEELENAPEDLIVFSTPSQLGLSDTSCSAIALIEAMLKKSTEDSSKTLIGMFIHYTQGTVISDLPPSSTSSKGILEIHVSNGCYSVIYTATLNMSKRYYGMSSLAGTKIIGFTWVDTVSTDEMTTKIEDISTKIEDIGLYSTSTPVLIGTFEGKGVYRFVLKYTGELEAKTAHTIKIGTHYGTLMSLKGIFETSGATSIPTGYINIDTGNYLSVYVYAGDIYLTTKLDQAITSGTIVYEYVGGQL